MDLGQAGVYLCPGSFWKGCLGVRMDEKNSDKLSVKSDFRSELEKTFVSLRHQNIFPYQILYKWSSDCTSCRKDNAILYSMRVTEEHYDKHIYIPRFPSLDLIYIYSKFDLVVVLVSAYIRFSRSLKIWGNNA